MAKPSMKYCVVTGKNPRTSETQLLPKIVDRTTYYVDAVMEYALNSAYVRGQFDDMSGVIKGFFRACKELVNSGFAVNLANWIRIHPELTGQVGEDRQLSAMNKLHVNVTPLQDMKDLSVDDFSWTSTEETGKKVDITNIFPPNGDQWTVKKSKDIYFTGKNLQFNTGLGDKITVEYDGLATPIQLTPAESSYSMERIAWPTALADIEDGTILIFKQTSRAGIEGAPDQTVTRTATFHV